MNTYLGGNFSACGVELKTTSGALIANDRNAL